jgi:hypothetical protein
LPSHLFFHLLLYLLRLLFYLLLRFQCFLFYLGSLLLHLLPGAVLTLFVLIVASAFGVEPLLALLMGILVVIAPLEAVRDALVDELGRIYDADRELVLARTKLIHREPALLAAAVDDTRALQAAFSTLFAAADAGLGEFDGDVLAGACVAVLTTAIDHWQRADGATPLATHIVEGFDVLRRLTWRT